MNVKFVGFKNNNYMVSFDEQRFQQVLLNFQSNAIKFMHKENSSLLILVQLIPKHAQGMNHDPQQAQFKSCVKQFYGH